MADAQFADPLHQAPARRSGAPRGMKQRRFTPEEDEIIRTAAGRTSVSVAEQLGRPPPVVRMRARRLGLGYWMEFRGYRETQGYKVARINRGPDGSLSRRVPVHRDVVAKAIGRDLREEERVHHINLVKQDNRIENLHLFPTDVEHRRAHNSVNKLIAGLLDRGHLVFDRDAGVYRLGEQ